MPKNKLDWRKPEDYEFTKGLSLEGLAWQFLRRCPEYRKEYIDVSKKQPQNAHILGMIFNSGSRRWGLHHYLDPARNFDGILGFYPPGGEEINPYSLERKGKGLILISGTREVYFKFDVRLPLKPQIENARKELKAFQKKCPTKTRKSFKPRDPRDDWPKYLRLLDASTEGALGPEIEAALYPTSGRFFDKKAQALRMACEDYRYIPFLTKNPLK